MRLHRLELTAFGPFAERQVVDFDRLSTAGLFLLHGPTGAGKTSVLDAVCFALYGRVPGERGHAGGRLRSDHAAPTVAPEVTCEFSVGGRRFEVCRSAEWHRPKKRGTGTVREPAHVVLRERVGDRWNPLTNRMDEAGDLLQQVIGLGAEQFTKLILLPQGDFAAFLRAGAEERRQILQRLFGTDRFAEVEHWLAERRRETEHQVRAATAVTAQLAARALEARLPEGGEGGAEGAGTGGIERLDDPADPAGPGDEPAVLDVRLVAEQVGEWASRAGAAQREAAGRSRRTLAEHEAARRARLEAEQVLEREQRRRELSERLARLVASEAEQRERRAALAAAEHARVLEPLVHDLDEATAAARTARRRLASAHDRVRAVGLEATLDGEDASRSRPFEDLLGRLREELGALADLSRAEQETRGLQQQLDDGRALLRAAEAEQAAATTEIEELTARHGEVLARREAATRIAATLADREQAQIRATELARAVLRRQELQADLRAAEDEQRTAVDIHQAAVDQAQTLRARRLEGMAAELAAGLVPGESCPVCGGAEHPSPARHRVAAVTAAEQRRAERTQAEAEAAREKARECVRELERELAAVEAISGEVDPGTAATRLAEAAGELELARTAQADLASAATEIETLTSSMRRSAERGQAAARTAVRAREEVAALTARQSDLRERIDRARGEDRDIAGRCTRLRTAVEALEHLTLVTHEAAESRQRLARSAAAADLAATTAGFDDARSAAAALLSQAQVDRLRRAAEEYERDLARALTLLGELPAPPAGPVDPAGVRQWAREQLERAQAAEESAATAHEEATRRHALAVRSAVSLRHLTEELERHAEQSEPLRAHFATLEALSRCAEGTGGDNTLRMRLSSYVLAARLEQVARAAGDRLASMSGGRYQLVHTDGPARSGARSGLGLAVIDTWTGVQRDPASLSGGETFCTSLALALGLADVVQAEAGGSTIETLLVDEGFGSLDEETLDEVMDVLDGLRTAGRAVGLVSHVSDLRDRIPAQLEVVKTRTGSRLIA